MKKNNGSGPNSEQDRSLASLDVFLHWFLCVEAETAFRKNKTEACRANVRPGGTVERMTDFLLIIKYFL